MTPDAELPEISGEEIRRRLRDPSLVIVDALPRESYAVGHIPGAVNLPAAEAPERARQVLPDQRAETAVYCGGPTCPAAERAGRSLREQGYTHVRHYRGGLEDWRRSGGVLENGSAAAVDVPLVQLSPRPRPVPRRRGQHLATAALMTIEGWNTGKLFRLWLAMIAVCGAVYWVACLVPGEGLVANGERVPFTLGGLGTAIYFSFVTAATVGYGDVVPMGAVRILAVGEAVAGLLAFGSVVSKFVSRRQDEVVREIHRVTSEDRLDRVQTNLHLVLSELQVIAEMCGAPGAQPETVMARLESAALVFAGELRTVHDLLYQPQRVPEEVVLEAMLASLSAALSQLVNLLSCIPGNWRRSATLDAACQRMARLAEDICGECVPRTHARALTMWMDRVQETARRLA